MAGANVFFRPCTVDDACSSDSDDMPSLLVSKWPEPDTDSDDDEPPPLRSPLRVPPAVTPDHAPDTDDLPVFTVPRTFIPAPSDATFPKPLPVMPRPTVMRKFEREAWVKRTPTRVQQLLDQPFGKENLSQCFRSEACLRHVLLPV